MVSRKIVLAIGGSSGSVYAHRLMTKLKAMEGIQCDVVMSSNAFENWRLELGDFDPSMWPFTFFDKMDFNAPFASGSARYDTMIVCPCSMGLIGRIASGVSGDLITRAADVMLKERRRLILVARETPYSLIHLKNMTTVTEAGAIVCPATPSFYSKPSTIDQVVDTVVDRVLDLANLEVDTFRWNDKD